MTDPPEPTTSIRVSASVAAALTTVAFLVIGKLTVHGHAWAQPDLDHFTRATTWALHQHVAGYSLNGWSRKIVGCTGIRGLAPAGLLVAALLLLTGRPARGRWVATAVLAGGWGAVVVRAAIHRPNDSSAPPLRSTALAFPSVPSAIAVLVAAGVVVAAWSLPRSDRSNRWPGPARVARRLVVAGAVVLPVLVGLAWWLGGEHTPLDVLAGWLVGLGAVLVMLALAPRAEIRGPIPSAVTVLVVALSGFGVLVHVAPVSPRPVTSAKDVAGTTVTRIPGTGTGGAVGAEPPDIRRLSRRGGALPIPLGLPGARRGDLSGAVQVLLPGGGSQLLDVGMFRSDGYLARFGAAVVPVDLDRDGYGDLLVGSPEDDHPGSVDVLLGVSTGIGQARARTLHSPGQEPDGFGSSLALTTTGGDGRRLWVGAPRAAVNGRPEAGAVYEYQVARDGTITLLGVLTQDSPGVPDRAEAGDHFGAVLGPGGGDDGFGLLIGDPDEDVGGARDAGEVFDVGVSPGGTVGEVTALTQSSPATGDRPETGDRFGAAVAGGPDVVVGVPGEDVASSPDAGSVQVFSRDGRPARTVTQATAGGHVTAGNQFGAAVALGEFDCEGYQLAIGAPGTDVAGTADAGVVRIVDARVPGDCPVEAFWSGHGLPDRPQAGSRVGAALGRVEIPGDSDGDDLNTLLIGAPGSGQLPGSLFVAEGRLVSRYTYPGGHPAAARLGAVVPTSVGLIS